MRDSKRLHAEYATAIYSALIGIGVSADLQVWLSAVL